MRRLDCDGVDGVWRREIRGDGRRVLLYCIRVLSGNMAISRCFINHLAKKLIDVTQHDISPGSILRLIGG